MQTDSRVKVIGRILRLLHLVEYLDALADVEGILYGVVRSAESVDLSEIDFPELEQTKISFPAVRIGSELGLGHRYGEGELVKVREF